jgi:hypothetical protein
MLKHVAVILTLMTLCWSAQAVERRHGILVGEVLKLDAATRTAVIKLADGTEHTLHFVQRTAVHGTEGAAAGAGDVFHGLKQGTQVAVHYSAVGTKETAEEVDNVGKEGLKATDATVTHIDRGAKTMVIKTADGTEETYHMTDSAARYAGKDVNKAARTTVYYTEEGGHKVVHFFKRAI